jgi:PhnB protein
VLLGDTHILLSGPVHQVRADAEWSAAGGFHEVIPVTHRPNRYRNAVVPHIYVDGAAAAIAFYTRAFGAVELFRVARADGKIPHADIAIAGSVVMIGDPAGPYYGDPLALGRCTTSLHLFVDDNVQFLRRAVEAGAETIQRSTDMFYGANSVSVRDPFGHVWVLLSWKEDLEPAEIERRGTDLLREHAPRQQ